MLHLFLFLILLAPNGLTCSPAKIFSGADDGVQNALAFDTLCQATSSGQAEVVYTLTHDRDVAAITTWLGTPLGSIEEVAGQVALEVPVSGGFKTMAIFPSQKDKHGDVEGEQIEHYQIGTYHLPAGSRIHLSLNIGIADPATQCPKGCGMQLNVYLNGPANGDKIPGGVPVVN